MPRASFIVEKAKKKLTALIAPGNALFTTALRTSSFCGFFLFLFLKEILFNNIAFLFTEI